MTLSTNHQPFMTLENVTKLYRMGDVEVQALGGVSLAIAEGEYVAIMGPSGSGKSTLMNILGLLDRPTSGSYRIRGAEASQLSGGQLADLRNREIGFIFQRFNLLPRLNARRQVELPLFYANTPQARAQQLAMTALGRVGLVDRAKHSPEELSGGQQQRVAVARALVGHPGLVLADEPTGALDSKTGAELLTLFDELHQQGLTLIVVTHDINVGQRADRMITLSDGNILEDRPIYHNGHNGHNGYNGNDGNHGSNGDDGVHP